MINGSALNAATSLIHEACMVFVILIILGTHAFHRNAILVNLAISCFVCNINTPTISIYLDLCTILIRFYGEYASSILSGIN